MENTKQIAKETGSEIAILLQEIASSLASDTEGTSIFTYKGQFSLQKLIERSVSRLSLSSNELIYGVILLDRYINVAENVFAEEVPMLLLSALNLAQKSLRDTSRSMHCVADVAKTQVRHVRNLESLFLKQIDYMTFVSTEEFNKYNKIKKL